MIRKFPLQTCLELCASVRRTTNAEQQPREAPGLCCQGAFLRQLDASSVHVSPSRDGARRALARSSLLLRIEASAVQPRLARHLPMGYMGLT